MENIKNEQELKRFKLLLKYDTSKTLSENVKDVVTEQIDNDQISFVDNSIVQSLANSNNPTIDKYRDMYVQEYIKGGLAEPEATARYNRIAGDWWKEYGNQEASEPNTERAAPEAGQPEVAQPTESESNILTDEDMMGNTNIFRSAIQQMSDFAMSSPLFPTAAFGQLFGLPNLFDAIGLNPANILAGRRTGVKGVVDALDGWISKEDLTYVLTTIKTLEGKCYVDDTQIPPVQMPAMKRFMELYSEDENGEDLIKEIDGAGTKTLPAGTEKLKQKIINLINSYLNTSCTEGTEDKGNTRVENIANIYCSVDENGIIRNENSEHNGKLWDSYVETYNVTPDEIEQAKLKCPEKDGGATPQKPAYAPCHDFPFTLFCINEAIKNIQNCLELKPDGMFGPKTMAAIKNVLPDFDGNITEEVYTTLIARCERKAGPAKLDKLEPRTGKLKLGDLQPNKPTTIQGRDKTPEQVFAELKPLLNIGNKRIKLKGNIDQATYGKLTQYLSGLGYKATKVDPRKDYGAKYVWIK